MLIEEVDDKIISLLKERILLAKNLAEYRVSGGWPSAYLSEECDLITKYVDALGEAGAHIVLAIMKASK